MALLGLHLLKELNSNTKILLLSSFLIPFGSFMIVPFIPIFLHNKIGMPMTYVGLVLGLSALIQFGGGFVGGVIADNFGYKKTMISALFIRSFGFLMLVLSLTINQLALVSIIIIAIGAALYLPANKAYLIGCASKEEKALFLSLSNSALNAGMGLGPLVGGLAIAGYDFELFLFTTSLFVIIAFLHTKLDKIAQENKQNRLIFDFELLTLLKTPLFCSLLIFYLYFFFQNYFGVYITISYTAFIFSLSLVINSLMVIIFQPILSKFIEKIKFETAILMGIFLIIMAMLAIFMFGIYGIFIGVLLFSLSEIILFLKLELKIIASTPNSLATGFGMQRLAIGFGAFLSSVAGGKIFDSYSNNQKNLFWLDISYQAIFIFFICVMIFMLIKKSKNN